MLPDFRKTRMFMTEQLNAFLKERIKVHSHAFEDVPVMVIHEGTGSKTVNAYSNFENEMVLSPIEGSSSLGYDELISDPTQVYKMLDNLAEQMAFQQGKLMLKTVSDVTERTGQVTKGGSGPETILEMYSKVRISFNKSGEPEWPVLYCAPEMADKLKASFKKLETEPYATQLHRILAQKKQEWNDRENNRKLVG